MTASLAAAMAATPPHTGLELVEAVYAAYARRDLNAAAALFHPEGRLFQTPLLPWGGQYRGREGLVTFMIRLTAHIDTQIVDERLFETDGQVISVGRTRGRALTTGAAFELDAVHIYSFSDGLIHRYEAYVDTPGMLKALASR